MIWWLRTHRAVRLTIAGVGTALAGSLLGGMSFLFPTLQGGSPFGAVPLFAVFPLAATIAVSTCLAEADKPLSRTAARARLPYDWGLACAVVLSTAAIASAMLPVRPNGPIETVRNLLGFVGLQWLLGPVLSYRYQAAAPVLYVFVSAVFGRAGGSHGSLGAWAWPLAPSSDDAFLILPVTLFVLGSVVALARGPAPPPRSA